MWVRDEAQFALDRDKILPIIVDDCDVPFGFRGVHAIRSRELGLISKEILHAVGVPDELQRGVASVETPQPLLKPPDTESEQDGDEEEDGGNASVDRVAHGADLRFDLEITLIEAFHGKTANINLPRPDGSTQNIQITIPAGIEDGTHLRLVGQGSPSSSGQAPGDLYVFVSIKPHEFLQRDGADLFCRMPISMPIATLGGGIDIPLVDGSMARVKVPGGTESGKQFRLKGKGMPVLHSKLVGDLYIQVEVETSKNLTHKQRELLEAFERESNKETSPHSAGFFSKMKEFFESEPN
jgi:DnaJ-class molecular chaperone